MSRHVIYEVLSKCDLLVTLLWSCDQLTLFKCWSHPVVRPPYMIDRSITLTVWTFKLFTKVSVSVAQLLHYCGVVINWLNFDRTILFSRPVWSKHNPNYVSMHVIYKVLSKCGSLIMIVSSRSNIDMESVVTVSTTDRFIDVPPAETCLSRAHLYLWWLTLSLSLSLWDILMVSNLLCYVPLGW